MWEPNRELRMRMLISAGLWRRVSEEAQGTEEGERLGRCGNEPVAGYEVTHVEDEGYQVPKERHSVGYIRWKLPFAAAPGGEHAK